MTDNNKRNNNPKVETVETETTERTTTRQTGRAPHRNDRVERSERPRRERDGVAVYGQATSALPAGNNLSWGSIFAGAVTATAVFVTLSLITAALGFGLFSPTSANPLSGVGVGTGIWTAITLILSFLCGGFISGYAARSTGKLHGAITWALSILLLLGFAVSALSSLLGLATSAVGAVAGTAADIAGSAVSMTGDAIGSGFEAAGNAIGDVDTTELRTNVETYLADTDIPELQPEYIENELQASRDEITQAVKDLALNPNNANTIISNTTASLQNRAQTIANAADRDAIANAVANNSDLTQAEAEEVTDNIYNGLVEAGNAASNALETASTQIDNLSTQAAVAIDNTMDDVARGAEDASNKASAGSVITFIGLILALLLSVWGGQMGEDKATQVVRKDTIR